MEKSRAIELLEHLAWDRDIERNPYGDALNMAIKALKAQLSQEGTTSDLISRQDAIDAAKDWYKGLICGSVNGLIKRLNALPSAQPELIEKTAYIRGFEQGRTQGMIDAQGGKK